MTDVVTGDIMTFEPNLQVPYSQTWTAGWQRKLTGDMAFEARYVGTRSLQSWQTYNYNELNIVENGFLNEFRQAQANLPANIAAGRGNSFAYTGVAGTAPLPIFLAYFNGQRRRGRQFRRLYRRQLDQLDVPGVPRGAQSEPVRDGHQHDNTRAR